MAVDWLSGRFSEVRPQAMAALTRQFRDIDLAEEAFADACLRAVERWPQMGLPDDPLAWLLHVARNRGIDRVRKAGRHNILAPMPETRDSADDAVIADLDLNGLRDDVLRLLFVCCHPALARQDQLALALRVVGGLSTAEIAGAFLIKPRAMEQRITRAKRTIAQNPVPFDPPDLTERAHRLRAVSQMVYLMFNEGWSASSGDIQIKLPLCIEAIRLARLLLSLYPGMSELMGLLALLLFQHARTAARIDASGHLVPLDRQDRGLWDRDLIKEARYLVAKARRSGQPAAFQLQAQIAEAHAVASSDSTVDWHGIEALYRMLYQVQPTPIVRLNQAVAVGRARGPDAALAILDTLAGDLHGYRWFHTTTAAFRLEGGDAAGAIAALEQALTLNPTAPERQAMLDQLDRAKKSVHAVGSGSHPAS